MASIYANYNGTQTTTSSTTGPVNTWTISPTETLYIKKIKITPFTIFSTLCSSFDSWIKPTIKPPKNWRWFHVFNEFIEPVLPSIIMQCQVQLYRVQEKYPILQRMRQKRKMFVQSLAL